MALKNGKRHSRVLGVEVDETVARWLHHKGGDFSSILKYKKLTKYLSRGRVGWNVVSSYMESASMNLLNGQLLPEHDERYVRAQELN